MITLRDVERLSDRLARLRSKATPADEPRRDSATLASASFSQNASH